MAQAYGASNESYHELTVKMPFLEKYLSRLTKENIKEQGTHTINENLMDTVKAENLSFKYQDSDEYLFSGLTFNIKKDSHSVIVGKNGTGKSTLIGIIAGILTPSKGKVEISSQNIGYVGNKPYIFQSSLVENIRITEKLNKVEETKIDDLFKYLAFYENFPNNYINKTVSKETLSDGQMQKLAFIRLILQEPEIIFLDEAFSNLDRESADKIKNKIFVNTTVINVTHSPEDFDNIDNKLLIENGNIFFQK
jgi:ABC-type transport system involved in cytochrome bd biosynthesis fused ATPase/permease subunit